LKKILNIYWKNYWVYLVICLVSLIYYSITPLTFFSDSLTYLDFAQFYRSGALAKFETSISSGYPLIICLCYFLSDNPISLLVGIQSLSALALTIMCYNLAKNIHPYFALLFTGITFILLIPFAYSKAILTEQFYIFFLFSMFYLCFLIISKNKKNLVFFIPLLSLFLVQIRPAGMLFPFLVLMFLILWNRHRDKAFSWKIIFNILIYVGLTFSFNFILNNYFHNQNLEKNTQFGKQIFLHAYLSSGLEDETTPKIQENFGANSREFLTHLRDIVFDKKMFPEKRYFNSKHKVESQFYLPYESNPQLLLEKMINSPVRCYWSTIIGGLNDKIGGRKSNNLLIGVSIEIIKNNPYLLFKWVLKNAYIYTFGLNANYKSKIEYKSRFAKTRPYLASFFQHPSLDYLTQFTIEQIDKIISHNPSTRVQYFLEFYALLIWPKAFILLHFTFFMCGLFGLFLIKDSYYPIILLGNLICLSHALVIVAIGVPIVRYNTHTYLIELFVGLLVVWRINPLLKIKNLIRKN